MKYQNIFISFDETYFVDKKGRQLFGKKYEKVMSFHSPGIAPVEDENGWFYIDSNGNELFSTRYKRAFGFYCGLACVVDLEDNWYYINQKGVRVSDSYAWCGNFCENLSSVCDKNGNYFHIDISGSRLYSTNYKYVGDFKYGIACVTLANGLLTHIDINGNFIHNKFFMDLDVYHKGYARAKDEMGWFHIDKKGNPKYDNRFKLIEPFYNGYARVETLDGEKIVINENGITIRIIG